MAFLLENPGRWARKNVGPTPKLCLGSWGNTLEGFEGLVCLFYLLRSCKWFEHGLKRFLIKYLFVRYLNGHSKKFFRRRKIKEYFPYSTRNGLSGTNITTSVKQIDLTVAFVTADNWLSNRITFSCYCRSRRCWRRIVKLQANTRLKIK